MIFRRFILAALAMFVAAFTVSATAQSAPYRYDIGAGLGITGYSGDANRGWIMKHPGFTAEASFGYLPNVRWAFRGKISVLTLSGNTADVADVLPSAGPAAYDFTSTVYDLGGRVEFNFFNYGIGETYKKLRRWTPYLALGVGCSLSSSGGETAVAPTIPMGFGAKYKISRRVNLAAEFSMTKVFGDKTDGPWLNDLNKIKTSFYKDTDWFSRFTIAISYEFGERCETCHYVD